MIYYFIAFLFYYLQLTVGRLTTYVKKNYKEISSIIMFSPSNTEFDEKLKYIDSTSGL